MKVVSCGGRLDIALTNGEVAEAFTLFTLFGVTEQDGLELVYDLLMSDRSAVELVETLALKSGTQIEIILTRHFADQANLAEIGSTATIGATGGADDNFVVQQAGLFEDDFQIRDQTGQVALGLGEGEATGRQRHAGNLTTTHAGSGLVAVELVLRDHRIDACLVFRSDVSDN